MSGYSVSTKENNIVRLKVIGKRIIIMLMIVCLSLSMVSWHNFLNIFAAVATYGKTDDGIWSYKVLDTVARTVSIRPVNLGELKDSKVEIPVRVNIQGDSYTVREIASYAYSMCLCEDCLRKNRMSLSTAWEDDATNYEGEEVNIVISEVVIPSTIITIGDSAFADCVLSEVTFQDTSRLTTIGIDAFWGSTLETIEIPASVTSIGSGAFSYSELENIIFEEGIQITEIQQYTFDGSKLTTITLPETVTNIREGAFYACNFTEITIPKAVTNIGNYAFEANKNLRKVNFVEGNQLQYIRKGAFMECSLTEVTIPKSVTTIGLCAFGNNSDLETVTFQTISKIDTLNANAFAKVPGYNYEEDSLEDEGIVFNENTSVTHINVENYEVYQWLVNKDLFSDSSKVYSAKTRVFIDERKDENNQGDVDMKSGNRATISIEDYILLEQGYHFEGSKIQYSDTFNLNKTSTGDIEETEFVSYGYPYVVINANKEINEYEITYETYPGINQIENSKCIYGQPVTISSVIPTRVGYEFIGWCKNATGEGELYQPGQVINESFTDKNGEIVTLYAVWKEITKKVTIYFSTPKNISDQYAFEIVVMKNGAVIQQHDVDSSEVGTKKIVLSGARMGEIYTIKCTNYKKENGKKTYYQSTTKEVTIE